MTSRLCLIPWSSGNSPGVSQQEMITASLSANYHIYIWAKEALFSALAAVKSSCHVCFSLVLWWLLLDVKCGIKSRHGDSSGCLGLFPVFSSQSSSRAFQTLSSCVRSSAACVRWWRVTFSSSQVGGLQAQKSHNDFSHKMKGEKTLHTPTYRLVRSTALKGNVPCDPASTFYLCSVTADCRDVLLPLVTDQLSGQLDDHSSKPDHEACAQLLSTVLDNLDRKDVVRRQDPPSHTHIISLKSSVPSETVDLNEFELSEFRRLWARQSWSAAVLRWKGPGEVILGRSLEVFPGYVLLEGKPRGADPEHAAGMTSPIMPGSILLSPLYELQDVAKESNKWTAGSSCCHHDWDLNTRFEINEWIVGASGHSEFSAKPKYRGGWNFVNDAHGIKTSLNSQSC